tara:strand:+ start:145 stop:1473 length:1329 start_codon:yes stop_codon:yes gene_type:complete
MSFQKGASSAPSLTTEIPDKKISEMNHVIEVSPKAQDAEIKTRLKSILDATNWFDKVQVRVENGIVFIKGESRTIEHKDWATKLAQNTQSVIAVVNDIQTVNSTSWYVQELKSYTSDISEGVVFWLPYLGLALAVLLISFFLARLLTKSLRKLFKQRGYHPLLAEVMAKSWALVGFLVGLYIVLQILGLTTVALTVIGGTGLLGIILGIAFRDITENLLASVLLSIQSPFKNQDLIEIENTIGYVQALTIRATILLTRDGHEVQIPNATVYKSKILNFTSTPNRREHFIVGIGYDDSISLAQQVALKVCTEHPAVLKDPEPWILVEELAQSSVNLHVFFWLDGSKYHWRKVKSSLIRLVKTALQKEGISLPGQLIELILPDEVPIKMLDKQRQAKVKPQSKESIDAESVAEGGLKSDWDDIKEQGRQMREQGREKNLLDDEA